MKNIDIQRSIFKFIRSNIEHLDGNGSTGEVLELPTFELMPRDFLLFAEKDLEKKELVHNLVNATSNLKRAMDCQIDYLFKILNIDKFYRKNRLGIDRKLGFLEKTGVIRLRSLSKLNQFRNRLEHHYEIPKFDDIDVYLELVHSFISTTNYVIQSASIFNYIEMFVDTSDADSSYDDFNYGITSCYTSKIPSVEICFEYSTKKSEEKFVCELTSGVKNSGEKIELFIYLFKVHILLGKFYSNIISKEDLIEQLQFESEEES